MTRQHRGHRLGLLVKTAMLDWLAEAEPAIERIETGNAAANDHMIAVNDVLGFELDLPASHVELPSPRLERRRGLRQPALTGSSRKTTHQS